MRDARYASDSNIERSDTERYAEPADAQAVSKGSPGDVESWEMEKGSQVKLFLLARTAWVGSTWSGRVDCSTLILRTGQVGATSCHTSARVSTVLHLVAAMT